MLNLHCCMAFSLVVVSRVYSSLQCTGSSLWWLLLLWVTGSRVQVSVVVACGLIVVIPRLYSTGSVVVVRGCSCSAACGIFLDQGWNPCVLHWQVDSLSLRDQGRPKHYNFLYKNLLPSFYLRRKVQQVNLSPLLPDLFCCSNPSCVLMTWLL